MTREEELLDRIREQKNYIKMLEDAIEQRDKEIMEKDRRITQLESDVNDEDEYNKAMNLKMKDFEYDEYKNKNNDLEFDFETDDLKI